MRQFNKGLDYGLNHFAWRVYPSVNVVLEAGEEDWSGWLRSRCEQSGRLSILMGLNALDAIKG